MDMNKEVDQLKREILRLQSESSTDLFSASKNSQKDETIKNLKEKIRT